MSHLALLRNCPVSSTKNPPRTTALRQSRTELHSASVRRKGEEESRFTGNFVSQMRPIVALRQLAKLAWRARSFSTHSSPRIPNRDDLRLTDSAYWILGHR